MIKTVPHPTSVAQLLTDLQQQQQRSESLNAAHFYFMGLYIDACVIFKFF